MATGRQLFKAQQKAEKAANPKPRADKGRSHAPGAGRPSGTKKPEPDGLRARMDNVTRYLETFKGYIKEKGFAERAGLTAQILTTMKDGRRVLSEAEVSALENVASAPVFDKKKTY